MRLLSIIAGCAAVAALAASVAATAATSPDVSAGKALFMKNGCEQCHGTVGQGNRSAGVKLAPHPLPLAAFTAQLRKPRAEMPPYSATLVSDAEIAKIHAYLASIPDGKTAEAIPLLAEVGTGTGGAKGAVKTVASDGIAAGRTIFATQCASCHGTAGVGGGIGPALTGERGRKDLAATIDFIKHPKAPMPALYPSPLSDHDVAAVAAYVQSL